MRIRAYDVVAVFCFLFCLAMGWATLVAWDSAPLVGKSAGSAATVALVGAAIMFGALDRFEKIQKAGAFLFYAGMIVFTFEIYRGMIFPDLFERLK
jgi:multisubunit Na+/H+ antiporter MnhB subunit